MSKDVTILDNNDKFTIKELLDEMLVLVVEIQTSKETDDPKKYLRCNGIRWELLDITGMPTRNK